MKRAVCVLIPTKHSIDGTQCYLGVTRRTDSTKMGLPGGKVDPGETEIAAAIRETYEETGIVLLPEDLIPLFSTYCPGEVGYWVTTFVFTGSVIGKARMLEEGIIPIHCTEQVLCDHGMSPFANYNRGVFTAYKEFNAAK